MSRTKIKDHLGNEFQSILEMCRYYNMPHATVQYRLRQKWSVEKALTTPVKQTSTKIKDHLGNEFKSANEMCKYYNISKSTYDGRMREGWSLEKILTTPIQSPGKIIKDHLGNEFPSAHAMCEYYNISTTTFFFRLKQQHWSLEQALTQPPQRKDIHVITTDHLGNKFKSMAELCRYYGISKAKFITRMRLNWSLEKALTYKKPTKTLLNHNFKHINDICEYYNINRDTLRLHKTEIFKTPEQFIKFISKLYKNKQMTENLKILNCVEWPYFLTENISDPNSDLDHACIMHIDKILDIYHQAKNS